MTMMMSWWGLLRSPLESATESQQGLGPYESHLMFTPQFLESGLIDPCLPPQGMKDDTFRQQVQLQETKQEMLIQWYMHIKEHWVVMWSTL